MLATKLLLHPRTGKPLAPLGIRKDGRPIMPMLGGDGTDPLTRINDLSGRLGELTADELTELRDLLAEQIAAQADVDPASLDDDALDNLDALAQNAQAAAAELTSREQAAAERATRRDEALARAREAIPAEQVAEAEPIVEQTAETVEQAEAEREPVAASARPTPVPLRQVVARAQRRPDREPQFNGQTDGRVRGTLVASSGPTSGQDFGTGDDELLNLAETLDQAFRDVRQSRSSGRVLVASSRWSLGDEKVTSSGSADSNRAAMDRAFKSSLVASGGICKPVSIDYNVPTWSNVEEPVKAALPSIDAPRGGLQYAAPAVYNSTVYGAGVSIWSAANDANPAGSNTGPNSNPTGTGPAVKPCVEIDCGSYLEVDVEAIVQCAQVSNFRGRFSPENVQVLMTYLQQAFVATAEIERLKQMRGAAKHVTVAQAFGASRDLLNFFDRLRAYFRSVYRLSDNVALRVVLNSYVREIIRTDLRKAAFPYESGDGGNSLFVTDQMIDAWFASIGISPVWALDDDTNDQTFTAASAGTPGSPSTFPAYPARSGHTGTVAIRALAYPEGTFQRLDGGELNLGVVRDSALNAVNKYQVFSEVFEAVAMRGFEAIDFVGDFIPNGATAGTITPA